MKLIMIHGRDQQGKEPHKLRQLWVDTLKKGLKKNNLSLPDDLEIIFPFYGDLLDSIVNGAGIGTDIAGVIAKGAIPDNQLFFFNELLMEIAGNAMIAEQEISANFDGTVAEKGPLNWRWVQAVIRTIDGKTPFGDSALKKFTYDVFVYLTLPAVRKKINEFIISAIDNSPCVVVAHSLGTVVGYDVLSKHNIANVKKYITVGSPLGLASIKSKLTPPLAMPSCVSGGWFNAYDDRDVVALNPLDKTYFDITPPIVNKSNVNNSTDNRHGITGYLDDADVAKQIFNALK
jgi:hypothetical protein